MKHCLLSYTNKTGGILVEVMVGASLLGLISISIAKNLGHQNQVQKLVKEQHRSLREVRDLSDRLWHSNFKNSHQELEKACHELGAPKRSEHLLGKSIVCQIEDSPREVELVFTH